MATGVQVWSGTPATNATVDTNINWAEGMAPSQVNDSARAMMASVAKWRDDNNGTLVTSGTTTAFTVTTNQVGAALTSGYTLTVQFNATNDSSATLAPDGLAAKPMQLFPGVNVPYNAFPAGTIQSFTYSSTGTGQWVAIDAPRTLQTARFNSLGGTAISTSYTNCGSVTLSSAGTWFVVAKATVVDNIGSATFVGRLWDGTTVWDSASVASQGATFWTQIVMSAIVTNPTGALQISILDATRGVGGQTESSVPSTSGNDVSITAVRIA